MCAASSRSAALIIVAFSRSSKPIRPISWDSEIATSGSCAAMISAARVSNSALTGEKTEVIATLRTPAAPMSSAALRSSLSSSSAMWRPSNSCPPWTR